VQSKLQAYPTDIEADHLLLHRNEHDQSAAVLSKRRRMAILVRKGEKEILSQTLHMSSSTIKDLEQAERKRLRQASTSGGDEAVVEQQAQAIM
jgi:hypothetical protein